MNKLLKIEFEKIKNYRTFWVLVILNFVLLSMVVSGAGNFSLGLNKRNIDFSKFGIYNYPNIWHNVTYIASWFKLILAVLVIILITNEFEFRTIRQNIIDGLSRADFILSKIVSVLLLSILSTIYVLLLILIFGVKDPSSMEFNSVISGSTFIFGYFIQLFAFLAFAFLIGFLVKRSGLAIGLLLLYTWVIEPIISYKLPDTIAPYLPLNTIGNLISSPFQELLGMPQQEFVSAADIFISLLYALLFFFLSYVIFKKRDI